LEFGGGGPTMLLRTLLSIAACCAILSLPVCTRTTGLSITATWLVGLGWGSCMVGNDFIFHPLALRSRPWAHAQMAILLAYNGVFDCALPVIGNQPQTPLWMVALLWAGYTGTWQGMRPSWTFLLAHTLLPLATIPIFLARGADPHWAIAGPVIAAMVNAVGYDQISMMTAAWRQARQAQAAALEASQQRSRELEQQHVARELHDGVGAALALARTSADLFSLHADSPEMLRLVASALRDSSADALKELRTVLDVLAPTTDQPKSLATTLQQVADQFAAISPMVVTLKADAHTPHMPPVAVRLAAVQILRESLRNALEHGKARLADVTLLLGPDSLELTVVDNGNGFDDAGESVGRGLSHLRARCAELGGHADIRSTPDVGTVVRCTMRFADATVTP
jgi:signal transduction histidine kinase